MSACVACAMDDNATDGVLIAPRPSNIDINESPSRRCPRSDLPVLRAGVEISSNFGTEFRYGAGNLFATFPRVSRRDSAIMSDRWIFATPARFRLSPFPSRRTRRRTRVARSASNRSSIFAVSAGTFMSVPLRTRGLRKASIPKRTDKKTRTVPRLWNGMERSGGRMGPVAIN